MTNETSFAAVISTAVPPASPTTGGIRPPLGTNENATIGADNLTGPHPGLHFIPPGGTGASGPGISGLGTAATASSGLPPATTDVGQGAHDWTIPCPTARPEAAAAAGQWTSQEIHNTIMPAHQTQSLQFQ